jgi:serine/threonine-protein kinase
MGTRSDGAVSGIAEVATSDRGDPTRVQDLHACDTVLLPAARGCTDERSDTDDDTRVDARGEIIVKESRARNSSSPPAMEPASNPDPTTTTKLDPGIRNLVPGTLVGEFVIERLLGAGGMGQVYGGRHEQMGRRVAVKVIAPSLSSDRDASERFEQEAIALARMSHPNIVGVLSVGTLPGDGRSYYVMEWLDGESLQARLDRGRIVLDDALDVLDQIARGLEAAHASGIIHRDLKPDNVWLQRVAGEARPVVKILDFGLAKLEQHRRSEHTATGVWIGTAQFLSPEQCQSARAVGPATDVYALGCMAYELLCGRLPFDYDNAAELIAAHQTEEPGRPRDLDPAVDHDLDELVFATLAKDPARRPSLAVFRSTSAAVRMRRAGFSRTLRAAPPTIVVGTSPVLHSRSRRWVVAAIAVALLLALVLIVTSTTRGGRVVPSAARAAFPGDDPQEGSTKSSAPVDAPAAIAESHVDAPSAESHVDAASTMRPPREVPRAAAPSVHVVPHDRSVTKNSRAAVPVTRELNEKSRELPVSKVPELLTPRPPAPPAPTTSQPDRNQTFNPFTGRPVPR